ncbi:cytochrome b [Herbaspirillum huttiense F1]|uniref:Cytochrome b n=1 Tax=Herbaspirillum huttiense subsp. lycopersici TaxID=3074428 RepID=A0ABU2EQJ8_9BURK|nr:cytochrome b [Herbaspirillum huttiense]MDR9850042.1 cytochrome b [Herbaspirillum huttiense SE1]MDT0358837.1 cytochrome b [Herbaspirillum huttiense F1]
MLKNSAERFGAVAKCFHWTMAVAFILAYIVVYYVIWFIDPETSIKPALFGIEPNGELVIPILNIHWVLGVSIGVLVIPRLIWRWINVEPSPVPGSALEHLLAKLAHWALYLFMILMPLTGYLNTYDPTNFGLFIIPAFRETALFHWIATTWQLTAEQVETPIFAIHKFLGDWVVWVVVLLHIAAALFHHRVRKDATLVRMLPASWGGRDEGERR